MELVFRMREDRLDKHGRAAIWADIHWPGHRIQPGLGVKVAPGNWQPDKQRPIHTREEGANSKNLRLQKVLTSVGKLFTAAEADSRPAGSIAPEEVHAAVNQALGNDMPVRKQRAAAKQAAAASPVLTASSDWIDFYNQWKAENLHKFAESSLRLPLQVVKKLAEFSPALRLSGLDKKSLARYIAFLQEQGMKDSTVSRHYSFLRECHRQASLSVPRWLDHGKVRYGRPPSLRRDELLAIIRAPMPSPKVERERDVFVFQTLMLLRDIDLRRLRPHHVSDYTLPGYGPTPCAEIYQQKTGENLLMPLPPLAAEIWRRYEGRLPAVYPSDRNKHAKVMGQVAGLSREFVRVQFSGKTKHEDIGPIWQFLSSHAARHTGADMILFGSEGDQNLKECALGHAGVSIYGYDIVERYGPALLKAWANVLGTTAPPLAAPKVANGFTLVPQRYSYKDSPSGQDKAD